MRSKVILSLHRERYSVWAGVLVLFGLAFLVRLIGIGWGLPNAERYFSYHPDEWLVLIASYFTLNPYGGEWLPSFYNYGSLPLYLWSVWLHWLTAVGVIALPPESASAVQIAEWRAQLHWWARVLTALMAGGTAVAGARTTAMIGGAGAGWIAGLAITFAPAFVVHARFQTVDVPTTFFVALALYQSVVLVRSKHPCRTLLWGAVWAGCAAGCKYNAGLVVLALMVSWLVRLSEESRTSRRALQVIGGILLVGLGAFSVFLLVCPGSWADSAKFWRDFGYELRHVQRGHGDIFTDTGLGWLYHLHPNLTTGFTVLGLTTSIQGWILSGIRERALWGVLAFTLAYYLLIGSAEVRFLRYTLPMYPMLAIGIGLVWQMGRGSSHFPIGRADGDTRFRFPFYLFTHIFRQTISPLLKVPPVNGGNRRKLVRVPFINRGNRRKLVRVPFINRGNRRKLVRVPFINRGNRRKLMVPPACGGNLQEGGETLSEKYLPTSESEPISCKPVNKEREGDESPFYSKRGGGGYASTSLTLLVVLSLLLQAVRSIDYTLCMLRSDARDQAVVWIRQHIPPGATIAFPTVPWFYSPPLFPETGELRWQDRLERAHQANTPYRLISLAPPEWNAEALERLLPDYVLISEFEQTDVARIGRADYRAFRKVLERHYTRLQVFRNDPPLLGRPAYFPHDMLYICPSVEVWGRYH